MSEVSTQHALGELSKKGVRYVASGLRMVPTWTYKDKYNPIKPMPVWHKLTLPSAKAENDEFLPFFKG